MEGGKISSNLLAGGISAVVAATYAISFAALAFAGPLSPEIAQGITIMLVSAAIGGAIVALTSAFPFAIGGADSNSIAVFAAIGATLAERLGSDPRLAAHHLALDMMLGSVTVGLALVALGSLKMGRWIRFIPYPIVVGFLAATGWLLFNGSLRVIAGISLPAHPEAAFTASGAARLIVGVAFAGLLFVLRRIKNPVLVPALLIGGTALTDGILAATIGIPAARAEGWLVPAIGAPHLTSLFDPAAFADISWPLMASTAPAIATAVVVTLVAILFGAAGLEAQTGHDADLDRELRSSGFAAMASGFLGGSCATLLSNRSVLNAKSGGSARLSGLTTAGLCGLALLVGGPVLSMIARPILGGLLLNLGFGLLLTWFGAAFRRFSRADTLLVLAIVVVTSISGFLTALVIGLLYSCITFVIRYGRFRVVRYLLDATHKRSRVERASSERMVLEKYGDRIKIMILQGYVFFGTANVVLETARRVLAEEGAPVAALILDFSHVSGLDISAANSFAKLVTAAKRNATTIFWCGLAPMAHDLLTKAGDVFSDGAAQRECADLDRALEAAEEHLLTSLAHPSEESESVWLSRELAIASGGDALLRYFTRKEVAAGDYLFHANDVADSLYLVARGRLLVTIDAGNERAHLRTMNVGSFIGEMGLYSGEPRSADVLAETDVELYCLTAAALERMTRDDPALAMALHRLLFRLQAERLRFANAENAALHA